MTIGAKKYVAWVILLVGAAIDYFFFGFCIIHELPPSWEYYLWPVCATAVGVGAIIYLRSLYRIEPPAPPGAWRLTLTDLLAVTFFCGLVFSIFKALIVDEREFLVLGPLFSPLSTLFFLGGLLGASLNGIFNWRARFVYALLHGIRSFGWVVAGMLVLLIVGSIVSGHPSSAAGVVEDVLGLNSHINDPPMIWFIRSGLVSLAVSSCVLAKTRDGLRKEG